jgi:hypothetical protein
MIGAGGYLLFGGNPGVGIALLILAVLLARVLILGVKHP